MSPLKSPLLLEQNVQHGFYTRQGGDSSGIYASLNCGPGSEDDPAIVRKNRLAVLSDLDPRAVKLCGLHQIHSNIVHFLDTPWNDDSPPRGDAMVTRQKNIALGILTADCAPVLLADLKNGVIGAAHAGWQGALSGILKNTVRMMCREGAELCHIMAAVGPCIAQDNYEVGPKFLENFTNQHPDHRSFFKNTSGKDHCYFDLKGFVSHELKQSGLYEIAVLPHDTYADEDHFFSYRRTTHRGEKDYGRQISAIINL